MHIIAPPNARDIPLSTAHGSLLQRLKPPRKEVEEVEGKSHRHPTHQTTLKKDESTSPSPSQKEENKKKPSLVTPIIS
jgi:hypothetical protein